MINKFVVNEKKNNSKLGASITAKDQEKIMLQGYFIPTLYQLVNGVIFPADFCLCLTRRDSLTNYRAQKARENLREKGAEEVRRAFEKAKGC